MIENSDYVNDFNNRTSTIYVDAVDNDIGHYDDILSKNKSEQLQIVILPPINEKKCVPEELITKYLALAKSIAALKLPIRIIFVGDRYSSNALYKMHHSLHGLFRTLAMEKSNITSIFVEVDQKALSKNELVKISLDASKFCTTQEFKRIFISSDATYQYSFQELQLLSENERIKTNGIYLITGGIGKIGLVISRFLLEKYAAKLILVGRSNVSKKKLKELFGEQYSENIEYCSADITILSQVQFVIDSAIKKFGIIDGIIHSAGNISDGLLEHKKENEFLDTIKVKSDGVENLDFCTQKMRLDFFICFSSLSSVNGNVGQSDYVVGNNYLDLFSNIRNDEVAKKEKFGHTFSINWPLWASYDDQYSMLNNYLKETYGIESIPNDIGGSLLAFLINNVPSEISQIIPLLGDKTAIKESFLNKPSNKEEQKTSYKENDLDVSDHIDIVSSIMKNVIGEGSTAIDQDVSFGDLGLSSIMIQQLAQELSTKYKISVPPLVLFKYNSMTKIIGYIENKISEKNSFSPAKSIKEQITHFPSNNSGRIAIIGMSGKMPGSKDLEEYWKNLIDNKSLIKKVDRWKDKKCFAGIIEDYAHFDPGFFNMSMREAILLDPQQRLFLEYSYNTILDAGYRPEELTNVGVFVGAQFNDYKNLLSNANILNHPFAATGNSNSMIPNRVSYFFNFNGPSQTIDTACSSAIVAINRGIDCLHKKECDYILAGAVSLLLDPRTTEAAISMGILSPNYRCATFDESADGYVRGEGIGCVLLKRYEDAINDGDSIYGIIESIKESHGGRANSITAPNQKAQTDLIVSTYKDDLANRVTYIETHGTGTKLGDPIEIEALKDAWKQLTNNESDKIVHLGAVKTSVGHLEPAAGMASLFKILL
ncbi:MAG: SDR family NAD(P)-dependent oxidoreductase, partial [Holosporales bacterium]|nr:SDR family NAD(P)-dependent oxidoreductase [Holosporales bacterium]